LVDDNPEAFDVMRTRLGDGTLTSAIEYQTVDSRHLNRSDPLSA